MQNRIKSSAAELQKTYSLVLSALLIALYVAIDTASIYVTQTLQLTFSFLVLGMIGYQLGPITGCLAGICCDLVAYMVRPAGPIHLGFTLSTTLTVLIFALFLYKKPLSLWRIITAKAIINIAINIILNTFWLSNLYKKTYIPLLFSRIIKNIGLLPLEIALLFFVLNAFKKIMKKTRNY